MPDYTHLDTLDEKQLNKVLKSTKLFGTEYVSIEVLKGSRPALALKEKVAIFRTPTGKFTEAKIRQEDFSQREAFDIASQYKLFTDCIMVEYSNGEGYWCSVNAAPPPRKRSAFTMDEAELRILELEVKLKETQAQLTIAKAIARACTPIVMNFAGWLQLGSGRNLFDWLAGGTAQDETEARKTISKLLSDPRAKELLK